MMKNRTKPKSEKPSPLIWFEAIGHTSRQSEAEQKEAKPYF